jgi:hypothetical protein
MRSRDGNRTLLLSICTIIFFNPLLLSASEYLISYRYVVKDAILYNETLSIAKAMKKCLGTPQKSIILKNKNSKDLKELISKNEDEFIDFIHKIGLDVEYNSITQNMQNSSTTILTLKTTCFKVEFNENFAKIAPLK